MKEIKIITEEIEKEAQKNVEDFNLTKLCYKNIFEVMNNSGVFVKAFSDVTTFNIFNKRQICMMSFNFGHVEEADEKIYPSVDLFLTVVDGVVGCDAKFCLTLTPFNANLNNLSKNAGVYGGCDGELTKIWRKIMKAFFKDKWLEAFKQYCDDVYVLRDCAIRTEAENKLLKIKQKYEEDINSI